MKPTQPDLPESIPSGDADPFAIGWRYALGPDGRATDQRIPLTLEDALHPELGYVMSEALYHSDEREYLRITFRDQVADQPHTAVYSDMIIDWDDPTLRHHSPDVSVIPDVREPYTERTRFNVAAEGTRPVLVIEIVSVHTRDNDVETKLEQYHRAGVLTYAIIDRARNKWVPVLKGYQWRTGGYEEMVPDAQGRLWLEAVGAWLGVEGNRVICYDEHGQRLETPLETKQELRAARRERDTLRRRSEAAKRRRELAEERLEAAERRKEAEEAARVEAEQRAAAEAAARLHAERDKQAAEQRAAAEAAARLSAERDKQAAEAARLSAERDKQAAEAARVEAEQRAAAEAAARLALEERLRQLESLVHPRPATDVENPS